MKKLILVSFFASSLLFANDTIGFEDLSKVVEKLADNQIYLEKRIVKLENENKELKQSVEDANPKFLSLEKNDNTLNTNILKLSFQFDEFKKANDKKIVEKTTTQKADIVKQIPQESKTLIVVAQVAVIRKTPEIICGNKAKTINFGRKLDYTNKAGDWYLLEDGNYIIETVVEEYKDGKKYHMIKASKSSKKGGKC